MNEIKVLHVTAHLGGGIGRVLSRAVEEFSRSRLGVRHSIALLERPEKSLFVERAKSFCDELLVSPSDEVLNEKIMQADIVHLHWWHHPAVARWMNSACLPPMRLIIWSHISGLYVPHLTPGFVSLPARFLFTSPCSWENPDFSELDESARKKMDVVFSSGGFDDLPLPPARGKKSVLAVAYVGALNFAKLHPNLLDFMEAVKTPDFRLILVGDQLNGSRLFDDASRRGLLQRLEYRGFKENIGAELLGFDVLAHLLNPLHTATTENALLEAMAMGVVPIVLDNPAERHLVQHGETGIVVRNPGEFAQALDFLRDHPEELRRLSQAASHTVRERFSLKQTALGLLKHYQDVMPEEKCSYDFRSIFGETPAEWFRACLGPESWRFRDDGTVLLEGIPPEILFEKNKGSVFHYYRYFPHDRLIHAWKHSI